MNKVNITVKKEIKMDGRTNNTGRPVNKKSARQARLAKQAFYNDVNDKFVKGNHFKSNNQHLRFRKTLDPNFSNDSSHHLDRPLMDS